MKITRIRRIKRLGRTFASALGLEVAASRWPGQSPTPRSTRRSTLQAQRPCTNHPGAEAPWRADLRVRRGVGGGSGRTVRPKFNTAVGAEADPPACERRATVCDGCQGDGMGMTEGDTVLSVVRSILPTGRLTFATGKINLSTGKTISPTEETTLPTGRFIPRSGEMIRQISGIILPTDGNHHPMKKFVPVGRFPAPSLTYSTLSL